MKKRNTWHLNVDRMAPAYNLMGAVRGPDAESHQALHGLKAIVTQRVRGILFEYHEVAGDWRDDILKQNEVDKVRKICARLYRRSQQGHFLHHLSRAVIASAGHPIWGGLASALVRALEPHEVGN